MRKRLKAYTMATELKFVARPQPEMLGRAYVSGNILRNLPALPGGRNFRKSAVTGMTWVPLTPSKWSQTHSRPPETASRRHDPYKFYSILKRASLWKCIRVLHMALYEATSVKTEAYVVVA